MDEDHIVSEREERALRRNIEREIREVILQRDQLLREHRAQMSQVESSDTPRDRDILSQHDDNGSQRRRSFVTTEQVSGLTINPSAELTGCIDRDMSRRNTQGTGPTLCNRNPSPPINTSVSDQLDCAFDVSLDDVFRSVRDRLQGLSSSMFNTADEDESNKQSSAVQRDVEHTWRKELEENEVTLHDSRGRGRDVEHNWRKELEEKEVTLQDRERLLMNRDQYMQAKERKLEDFEKAMLDRMNKIEQEYKTKERKMNEKESEIHLYMRDTEKRLNERLQEMEMKHKRKEQELIDKERNIERLKNEWHEKFLHLNLLQRIQEDMIRDRDTPLHQHDYFYHEQESRKESPKDMDHETFLKEVTTEKKVKIGGAYSKEADAHRGKDIEIKQPKEATEMKGVESADETRKKYDDRNDLRCREKSEDINSKLNLTSFSGMEPVPRNEATFEEWKLEVECVKAIYSEMVVLQAIRKALKGQAKRIMLHLGPYATVEMIEMKLEDAFGNIASRDSILSHFFLAEQKETESIVEWGLRLEEMLLQASRKTAINASEKEDMLKRKFWRGLQNEELKNATRVHFESDISYADLQKKVRAEEFEIRVQREKKEKGKEKPSYKARQSVISSSDDNSEEMMKLLIQKIEQLDKKVDALQKENEEYKSKTTTPGNRDRDYRHFRGRGYARGRNNRGRGKGSVQSEKEQKSEDTKPVDDLNQKSSPQKGAWRT
ncbi:hypothetical protein DPMN_148729 [Dreissena polymorpha]|uniref:Paraneoplastic antigen Ma-like C-terminal domain-containing protein n=2 Tax=Dreissena polymorpha TaxID=45954 RepID=A0A9D4FCB6_DREPO|nr:hypothetical protein DPMN_148729 [Dreissena polymorpha]